MRERIDVISDALIRIINGLIGGQLVVCPILEVLTQEMVSEPTPPGDADSVSQIVVKRIDGHGYQEHCAEHTHGVPEACPILGRESGCKLS